MYTFAIKMVCITNHLEGKETKHSVFSLIREKNVLCVIFNTRDYVYIELLKYFTAHDNAVRFIKRTALQHFAFRRIARSST
ncbi:hypothetical protein FB480_10540 [Agrobacterium vitis]|nr:hypothetical protein FB480_10540 [Agrobacterium vitis]